MARSMSRIPRFAVLMAGGQGTRFWPLARRHRPKQFLAAQGKHSFLQETARRILPLFGWDRILVVTAKQHAAEVRAQLPKLPKNQILVEPTGRNTAACLALAGAWAEAHVGEAVLVGLPADHVIRNAVGLRRSLRSAIDFASRESALVVIGILPTRPETGYGYIEVAAADASEEASWVRRFHEKPDLAQARRYLRSPRYRWNAGMFVWRTSVFRAAWEHCLPDYADAFDGVFGRRGRFQERLAQVYDRLPNVSVDVALLQPLTARPDPCARVAVVEAQFDWMDAGSLDTLSVLWGRDGSGNAMRGSVVALDAANCVVAARDRPVVIVGARDLVVIDAGDVVLVCPRDQAQAVRAVPGELERRGLTRYA